MEPVVRDWTEGALAFLCHDSWAGRIRTPVTVLGPSSVRRANRTHVRVRFEADILLPGRRRAVAGDELAVPTYALRERKP